MLNKYLLSALACYGIECVSCSYDYIPYDAYIIEKLYSLEDALVELKDIVIECDADDSVFYISQLHTQIAKLRTGHSSTIKWKRIRAQLETIVSENMLPELSLISFIFIIVM